MHMIGSLSTRPAFPLLADLVNASPDLPVKSCRTVGLSGLSIELPKYGTWLRMSMLISSSFS